MITIGLYRHFKGDYFFVRELVRDHEGHVFASYFNVMKPELGSWVRPIEDFVADSDKKGDKVIMISDRPDNITGQILRFERVISLGDEVKNLSTKSLMNELAKRPDSPLQELDIEGVSDNVFSRDYVVGDEFYAIEDYPCGVSSIVSCETQEEASKYFNTHSHKKSTHVFKRVFIRVE